MTPAQTDALAAADRVSSTGHSRHLATWLERATVGCLFLFAFFAPHSIAATQTAWMLALVFWATRFLLRPRPTTYRTPVDYALLGFFILTLVSAFCSYDPLVSIGKLRAANLFTIVYVVAENIHSRRVLRALAVVLVASCMLNVFFTFGVYVKGRGVKIEALNPAGPLYAAGVRAGETLVAVDGSAANSPDELVRGIETPHTSADPHIRWPDQSIACTWDEQTACVGGHHAEVLSVFKVPRASLLPGDTAAARLGLGAWAHGHDDRATGFYGQYTTYAEALQLIMSLALGLFIALPRKRSTRGLLLGGALMLMTGALVLTVTRAAWLGFLLSAFAIALVYARRRVLLLTGAIMLPLALAGLFVLHQERRVGFIDPQEGSTAWRLIVWREGVQVLLSRPRHLLVGVGMDSIKQHWREWGMFEGGKIPWGHLHSTPLEIAFERGIPTLLVWLALIYLYVRMLWRLVRRRNVDHWIERGIVLGALGGTVGFLTSGLVHYNFGDSEVVMLFYFIMGLALAVNHQVAQALPQSGSEP
jgi:O-Antigen ligase